MNAKTKVLICIDWFYPAYKAGGPIQSVKNIVDHLGNEFDFWVLSSNYDLDEKLEISAEKLNRWIATDNCHVMYLTPKHQNYKHLKKIIFDQKFDQVYLNSLFSIKFSVFPLWIAKTHKISTILAPRGMLGAGALQIKPLKKRIFIKLFKILKLHEFVFWHATDVTEREEIQYHFGEHTQIKVAPNLVKSIGAFPIKKEKHKNHLKLFFLSRISKKKNLLAAIEYLQNIKTGYAITFSIIGPIEDPLYWHTCEEAIAQLPNHIDVKYLGTIPNHELPATLSQQELLLLPTAHENFGHVILEAWQAACPVIISSNTPWKNLVHQKLGYDIPLENKNTFVEAIEFFAGLNNQEFEEWSTNSYTFAKDFSENKSNLEKTINIFERSFKS